MRGNGSPASSLLCRAKRAVCVPSSLPGLCSDVWIAQTPASAWQPVGVQSFMACPPSSAVRVRKAGESPAWGQCQDSADGLV